MSFFSISFLALSLTVSSFNGQDTSGQDEIERLRQHAQSVSIDHQAPIYLQIAERELRYAEELYLANKVDQGDAMILDVISSSDKARDAAVLSGKHLKDTEIAVRKMAAKLRDLKRKVTFEEQAPLQAAADHLESLRSDLLTRMFKEK